MRSFSLPIAAMTALWISACRETGTLAACAGSFTGTYAGAKEGVLSATLATTGNMTMTFVFEDRELTIETTATSTGAFSAERGTLAAGGAIDLDACSGTGTWTREGSGSGTWSFEEV